MHMHDADWIGGRLIPALDTSVENEVAAHAVLDADEEIFLLYTLSAPEPDRMGLGQVDNKSDLMQVTIDLIDPSVPLDVCPVDKDEALPDQRIRSKAKQSPNSEVSKARERKSGRTLQVLIRQDSSSLRSTGGDTGSVIWRSSLYLAEKIIRDLSEVESGRRRHASEAAHFLLKPLELAQCRVLELGSGTGILPLILLSHPYLLRSNIGLMWLATDQTNMLPLLQKNLSSSPAQVGALDWVEASTVYHSHSNSVRQAFLCNLLEPLSNTTKDVASADLIIATDCIFNPSLFGPFVDTLNLCAIPQKTMVMVVCELREPEAMNEFLQTWLEVGKNGEKWSICALEGEEVLGRGLLRGSVVWVAWRLC